MNIDIIFMKQNQTPKISSKTSGDWLSLQNSDTNIFMHSLYDYMHKKCPKNIQVHICRIALKRQ